jgi:polar amino acid transport system substrate-binding protein
MSSSYYIKPILLVAGLVCSNFAHAAHFNFVTLVFPPLEYENVKGEVKGIAVNIVTKIMKNLGHTVSIKIYPWNRSLNLVKVGKADAIFTAYKNPDRELFLDYSKEILIDQKISFYVKKNSQLNFDGDFKNLIGKSIGTLNTVSYGIDFDKARTEVPLNIQRVDELSLNFKKLKLGRIDYVISNRFSGSSIIKDLNFEDSIIELSKTVESVPSYIAFSKIRKLTELRDKFDAELMKLKKSGWYDEALSTANLNPSPKLNK